MLIAYEARYEAYAQAFESALRGLRPLAEVQSTGLGELLARISSFAPHLVVTSEPVGSEPQARAAWFTLSPEPDEISEVCLGGRRRPSSNPGLEELLAVVDEAEGLIRDGRSVAC